METYGNWKDLPDREHRAFVERVEKRWEAREKRQSRGSAFFAAFLGGLLLAGLGFLPGDGMTAFPSGGILAGLGVAAVFFLLALVTAKNAPAAMLLVCVILGIGGLGAALPLVVASTVGLAPFGCLVAAIGLLGTVCSLA